MNIIQRITLLGGLAGSLWGQQAEAQKSSAAIETFKANGKEIIIQRSLRSPSYTLDQNSIKQTGDQYSMRFRHGDDVMMMTALNANKDSLIAENEVINKTLLWYEGSDAHAITLGYDANPDYTRKTGKRIEWAMHLLNGSISGRRLTDYSGRGTDRRGINILEVVFNEHYQGAKKIEMPPLSEGGEYVTVSDGTKIVLSKEYFSPLYRRTDIRHKNDKYNITYKAGENIITIAAQDENYDSALTRDEMRIISFLEIEKDKVKQEIVLMCDNKGDVTSATITKADPITGAISQADYFKSTQPQKVADLTNKVTHEFTIGK